MRSSATAKKQKNKTCFSCQETKPLRCFYVHKQMADGHLNKCKECVKACVRMNREANAEYYTQYDRLRYERERERRIACAASHSYPEAKAKWIRENRQKRSAHFIVQKKLAKSRPAACSMCGNESGNIQAHHHDYSKPLDVTWLCSGCHGAIHRKERDPGFKQVGSAGGHRKRKITIA